MSIASGTGPSSQPNSAPTTGGKPAEGRERFWDLKASHWVEVFLTLVLIVIGWLQYSVYTQQAKIMEIAQRPWISLDMGANEGLAFDEAGSRIFTFGYTLKNVGKLPAFNVDFIADIIPMAEVRMEAPKGSFGYQIPEKAIEATIESTCKKTGDFSEIIFPDVEEKRRWRVHPNSSKSGYAPGFAIIGCATYSLPNDPLPHQTIRVFELKAKAYGQMIDLSKEKVAPEELAFFSHQEKGGSRAN